MIFEYILKSYNKNNHPVGQKTCDFGPRNPHELIYEIIKN